MALFSRFLGDIGKCRYISKIRGHEMSALSKRHCIPIPIHPTKGAAGADAGAMQCRQTRAACVGSSSAHRRPHLLRVMSSRKAVCMRDRWRQLARRRWRQKRDANALYELTRSRCSEEQRIGRYMLTRKCSTAVPTALRLRLWAGLQERCPPVSPVTA